MDDATCQNLKAWIDFYRELGIEDFYRREPAAGEGLQKAESAQPAPQVSTKPLPAPAVFPVPPLAPHHSPLPIQPRAQAPTAPPKPSDSSLVTRYSSLPIQPPTPAPNLFEAALAPRSGPETLEQIRQDLGDCRRCKLAPTRKTIVFGQGNPHAELILIGEGPGADEDEQGLPFVGRAGKLLNRIIQTVGLKREDVYICNIVKCRPPENRVPEKDEVDACSPFLYRQIESIKPRLICCLGAPAARTVLGIKEGITRIHGQFYDFGSAKALATVHPAYVLRNPREEKILLEDFGKICDFLSKR